MKRFDKGGLTSQDSRITSINTNRHEFPELHDTIEFVHKLSNEIIVEQNNKLDNILSEYLLDNAIPKIKGKITKGKLRWRGIRLCIQRNGQYIYYWIEQRGKIISPKIYFESWQNIKELEKK